MVAVALVQGNLAVEIGERLAERAPADFYHRHPARPARRVRARSSRAVPGARFEQVPMLRGRITRLNGVPVEQAAVAAEAQWALRNDRGLTYAAPPPKGSRIVAGEWWPPDYRGPPLVSFDAALAHGMGLKVGDTLTVNLLGREITAAHRQSAADRMVAARHQFRHRVRAGHARSGAADPSRRRLCRRRPRRSAGAPQVTERFPNVVGDPGARGAGGGRAGRRRRSATRSALVALGDAGRRRAGARRRGRRRSSPARLRRGGAEGARRDPRASSPACSWSSTCCSGLRHGGWSPPASARSPPGRSSPGR